MADDDPAVTRQSDDGETIDSMVAPPRPHTEPPTDPGAPTVPPGGEPSGAMFSLHPGAGPVAADDPAIPDGPTRPGVPGGHAEPPPTVMPTVMETLTGHPDDPDMGRTEAFGTMAVNPPETQDPGATANWTVGQYLGPNPPMGGTVTMDKARTEPGAPDPRAARRGRGPGSWPRIPGYEILSELGRGGMGVVYKAHHQRLDIPVALKMVLTGAHASAEQLQRFEGEARAVAKLHHPNIVHIYHVDEHDGLPFFSLEFLDGGTLTGKLGSKPISAREAAELTEVLTRAMAVAHKAGIIHRDLKPANILLDAGGTPKITDFGLAKQLEEPEDGGHSGSTRTGAVMGTPSYMAPEQAWGRVSELGPKADQYALGAILYEMLTGRPPFQGANAIETLDLVRNREPVPPTQLQPKLPRDIETICLKALQKDPARRYDETTDLADDLKRFLAGEPIVARPVSALERAWRWCGRHRAVAALSAAAALLLMALAIGSTAAAMIFQRQRDDLAVAKGKAEDASIAAQKSAAEEKKQHQIAEDRLVLAYQQNDAALTAVHRMITDVQNQLKGRADMQTLRERLVREAGQFIDSLGRFETSRANAADLSAVRRFQTLGEIYQEMGRLKEAGAALEKMDAAMAAMEKALPGDIGVTNARAKTLNTLGDFQLRGLGNAEAAQPFYDQAAHLRREVLDDARAKRPDDVTRAADALATNQHLLAEVAMKLGQPREALDLLRKEKALRDALPETAPGMDLPGLRAKMLDEMGTAQIKMGNREEGRKLYDEALQIREAQARAAGNNLNRWNNVFLSLQNLGHVHLLQENDPAEALRLYQRALDGLKELADRDPKNMTLKRNLGLAWYFVAEAQRRLKADEDSARSFAQCLELRRELVKAIPGNKRLRLDLAIALARTGAAAEAAQTADEVLREPPTDNLVYYHAACAYAVAAGSAGSNQDGKPYAEAALAMLQRAIQSGWSDPESLRTDPDLDALRGDPRFTAILEAAEKTAHGEAVAETRQPAGPGR